ncbi:leukosialin [Sorex araneus]|uniref:leukosialin n=1 Tax=Sorex araneus TaxID=42254 RepID=UPI002433662C|nr:leukosialin [Sorex araneus]
MEVTLLLLLSVGTWAQNSTELQTQDSTVLWTEDVTDPLYDTSPWPTSVVLEPSASLATESTAVPSLSSGKSDPVLTGDPVKEDAPGDHIRTPPPSTTSSGHAVPSSETPTDRPVSVPTVIPEISTQKSSVFLDVSATTDDSAVSIATHSPGSQTVAGEILATGSLEPSTRADGSPISMTTGSLDLSKGTSGLPVSMVTTSPNISKETIGSPTALVKILTTASLSASTSIVRLSPNSDEGTKGNLLPVLVTLLVVIVLVALLLLWRRRQKRRTGVLMLNGVAKRNGVVNAWAGPAPMSSEEALTVTVAEAGGDKGSGSPPGEASGRRPTLTTFFSRRKSCQAPVALEDLGPGTAPGLKSEEEALMAPDAAAEAPPSDGPEAGDGGHPSSCE